MDKKNENITEIDARELFDEVSVYCDALIDIATAGGFMDEEEADNEEYTREIGRVANLCAAYEDTKMQFDHITVRGRFSVCL
ncbi:MAG: hypothetical protein LBU37_02335 [Tannerellaceae bacterium]|jgi:hypothetical protein|nr:hypothetical protein [Tannerellaceae bacterium]